MRFRYEPLITIAVLRERIIHNLGEFRAANPGVAVAPVLKSNAYGHGLVQVAEILAGQPIPFLCVDSYVEALILRNEGIRTPLLVIGYTPLENMERSALGDTAFGIMSMNELERLARARLRKPVVIHLKIDTGMHRQGIHPEELDRAIRIIKEAPEILFQGAYSHLADADARGSALTKTQIEKWNAAVHTIREKAPAVRFLHLSNTAGSHYAEKIDANVMRLGIGLYGINTSLDPSLNLLPALEMRTRITSVRRISAGESVGYNATFTAKRGMTIATIPVGYAEGIDRRLSNKGTAMVRGIPCPFVGRVNMNITSLDVSKVPEPKIDDEVLVISPEREAPNTILNMAKLAETIPYELLVHLPSQIRRVVRP